MSRPTIRFRIDFGPDKAVGPGKIALLEQIAIDGSLRLAARHRSISFRRAWLLLQSLNCTLAGPVTIPTKGGRNGGGSRLTPLGEELIRAYRAFEVEMGSEVLKSFGRFETKVRKAKRISKGARIVHLYDR